MPDFTGRRQNFRKILTGSRCVRPGSVFDPISARIAEDIGYEAGIFSGSVGSLVVLGAPDIVVLTLTEFADQAKRICRAGQLPLLVDADHGYGNAMNVARTVQELEAAGVAALTIEDTVLPKAFTGSNAEPMISIEEGVGKMRAAVEARSDANLVIAARTSAIGLAGIDEAIARCRAYQETGVDALFLTGIKQKEHIEALAAAVKIPMIFGDTAFRDLDFLSAHGVRVCLQGHKPFHSTIQTVYDVLKAERDGVAPPCSPAPPELLARVTRADDYNRKIKDYLSPR